MTKLHAVIIVLAFWPISAEFALADPLPNPPPLVLPDPSPGQTHAFPPSESTAGTADPGRKLSRVAAPRHDECTALSPCAVPPPSLERAESLPSRAPAETNPG